MTTLPSGNAVARCRSCGTELAPTLLQCPACGTLVHAERLTALAAAAERAATEGNPGDAMARWNEALELLPPEAPQRERVLARIRGLEPRLEAGGLPAGGAHRSAGLRGLWIAIGSVVLFALGKAKFLLLGLTKLGTLFSMLAFFGVYWTTFGWPFALGLVVSIYIHEMGHVAALRRYGIPASAPMFIPGLGALIRLKAHPPTPSQDARVGLAGPVWGTATAFAALGLQELTGSGVFGGIAHTGAWLNLFNLLPVWQLDGARGIAPLSGPQRGLLLAASVAAFGYTGDVLVALLALGLGIQTFRDAPTEGDRGAFALFVGVLGLLSWLVAHTATSAGFQR